MYLCYGLQDPMTTIYEFGRPTELRSRIRDAVDYVTVQWFGDENNMNDPEA